MAGMDGTTIRDSAAIAARQWSANEQAMLAAGRPFEVLGNDGR